MFEQLAAQEQGAPTASEPEETLVPDVAVAEGDDSVKPPDEPEAPPVQLRDEHGRFLPKKELAPEDVPVEGEPAPVPDEGFEDWETVPVPDEQGQIVEAEVSPELAAHINDLSDRAAKAESDAQEIVAARETMEEANQRQAELDEIQSYIEADPAGYLASRVRPELRREVVLDILLMDDSIYEEVVEQFGKWQYEPHERRIQSAERRATRVERAQELAQTRDRREVIQHRAAELTAALKAYVPTEMSPDTARRFADDMYRDLSDFGRQNGWDSVTSAELPRILAYRLTQYGVDPNTLANGAPRDASGAVVAQPANDAAKAIADARAEGARQKKQYQRRRAAGAAAPSGAGTPSNRARPPKGATLNEALDWAKQSIGSG